MTGKDIPGGAIDPATLKVHPLAGLFPLMEGREFEELVEDIRQNGLRTPILVDAEGRLILDGRNRLRACRAAGVEVRFERWTGPGTVAELILSLNLRRRHLNESQRAMLGARLAQESRKPLRGGRLAEASANWHSGPTAEQAAALLNVSRRSIMRAARLLESGDPNLIRAVESGAMAVSAASAPAAERPKRQRKPPSAEETLRRLWEPACQLARAVREVERRGGGPVGEA